MSDTQNAHPFVDRRDPRNHICKHEGEIKALAQRDDQMVSALKDMENKFDGKLDLILMQVHRIPVLEERHNNQAADISRAHDKIGKVEKTVEELARESREFIAYSKGMSKVLWAVGGVTLTLLIKVLFFSAQHGMTP